MSDTFDAKIIRDNGWRQGSLSASLVPDDLRSTSGILSVVISHDCDIVQNSLEKEPCVEILIAKPIEHVDGNYTKGKNARCYHLDFQGTAYEIQSAHRFLRCRQLLCCDKPDALKLPTIEIRAIVHWFAQRYERPAFPDNFNRWLSKKTKQTIENELKKHGNFISGIYISCPEYELPDEKIYEIRFHIVMKVSDYWDIESRGKCENMAENILESFKNDSSGIRIINSENMCVSENEITLHDLRAIKRFTSFDHQSYETGIEPAIS